MAPITEEAYYQIGDNIKVPLKLHQVNRQRLCERLKKKNVANGSIALLQGGMSQYRYCSDHEDVFRQESYFHWTFGVLVPDVFGAVEVDTGNAILFIPRLPAVYAVWMGKLETPEDFIKKYAVDECYYVDQMAEIFAQKKVAVLLTMNGVNTDSGETCREAKFDGIDKFTVDNKVLHPEIMECRVFKTEMEIEVMRYASIVSSDAHKKMMSQVKPGMYEYQMECIFLDHCYYHGGMRHTGYTSIAACGPSSAVLHYGHAGAPNSRKIGDGELCLFDMGSEYYCYGADITTTFPANGKFTEDQKIIYNAVLAANRNVLNACHPGVSWVDMHKLSEKTILEHLKVAGLVKGDVDEMVEKRVGAVFMPHGLGHFIGVDTHDVGGYPEGVKRIDAPGLRSLRTARVLEENMCITIEPGCYFVDVLLDDALANPEQKDYLVADVIQRFRGSGGVRIEDDILITKDGAENFSHVPRTIEEIETFMAKSATNGVH